MEWLSARLENRALWGAVEHAVFERENLGSKTTIEKVPSHSDQTPDGNNIADAMAKAACHTLRHDLNVMSRIVKGWLRHESRILAVDEGKLREGDLRFSMKERIQPT
eukprot:Lithocolla_globosa_v1_NODE_1564_length_2484_cov_11.775628.p3 type:complete len:107 gc:universal NODE_1564_length_2484_cov_11.775628:60-380(+)